MKPLVKSNGKIDRGAVFADARKQYELSKRLDLGWTWSYCIKYSSRKARGKRDSIEQLLNNAEKIIREYVND